MKEKILKQLTNIGLSEIEAKVYLAALAINNATADKISKYAEINRTATYPVIEKLKKRGFAGQVKIKGKTVYRPVSPEKIIDFLEERKKGFENVIPELKSIFELSQGNPIVTFYEGKDGLKTVLNSILKETNEVLIFGDGDSFYSSIADWADYYSNKREKKLVKSRIILKGTPRAIKAAKALTKEGNKFTKIRVLPESYKIDYSGFDVYNNKTILYSFSKQDVAVVIESKIISQMMRTIFEILWDIAENYNNTLLK